MHESERPYEEREERERLDDELLALRARIAALEGEVACTEQIAENEAEQRAAEQEENLRLSAESEKLGERYDDLSWQARGLVRALRALLEYERYDESLDVHQVYRAIERVEDALVEGEEVRPQIY